jgi:hypothetical protein
MSGTANYPAAVDACKLPGPNTLSLLAPGTVEVPLDSVKAADTPVVPADLTTGDNEVTKCRRLFARDLGGGKPNMQDYRLVTIAVVRFTGSDKDVAASKAGRLLTDALGDHSGVRLVTGVGDEAGFADHWAAVRTGNVVLGVGIADGGSEAALIPAPVVDNVQAMVTDMLETLQRTYQG